MHTGPLRDHCNTLFLVHILASWKAAPHKHNTTWLFRSRVPWTVPCAMLKYSALRHCAPGWHVPSHYCKLGMGHGIWVCARWHGTACSWPRTSHSTRLLKPTRTLIVGHIKTGVSQVCVQSGTLHTAFFGVPILIIFDFLIFRRFCFMLQENMRAQVSFL